MSHFTTFQLLAFPKMEGFLGYSLGMIGSFVIPSEARNLPLACEEIPRCAQNDSLPLSSRGYSRGISHFPLPLLPQQKLRPQFNGFINGPYLVLDKVFTQRPLIRLAVLFRVGEDGH